MIPENLQSPLRVSVQGMTDKMRNMLQYFFLGPCKNYCEMVDEESSELSIIDLDALKGRQLLEEHQLKYPEKPLIFLSLQDQEIEGAILVRKPLKPDLLVSALETVHAKIQASRQLSGNPNTDTRAETAVAKPALKEQASSSGPADEAMNKMNSASENTEIAKQPTPIKNLKTLVTSRKSRPETHQAAMFLNKPDEGRYIGSAPDIDQHNPGQLASAQYDPENYFLGHIKEAVIKAEKYHQAVLLTMPHGSLVALPDARTVLVNIKDSKLHAFCALPITDETLTKTFMEESSLEEYSREAALIELEPLLWKAAIWASRGRLPVGTSLTLPVFFQHWPNISRLLLFPHALRIAALWSEQPYSLLDTAKALQIPQRYVFAFYSACNAIGIATVRSESTDSLCEPVPIKSNSRRNLLGRILNHLRSSHQIKVRS